MRVLFVSELFYPFGGGAEVSSFYLYLLLRRRVDVVVASFSLSGDVWVWRLFPDRPRLWLSGVLPSWGRLLRGFDVVYIPRYAYFLVPLAKRLGLRVVVHLHNFSPVRYSGYFVPGLRDVVVDWLNWGPHRALVNGFFSGFSRVMREFVLLADEILVPSGCHRENLYRLDPRFRRARVLYNFLPRLSPVREPAERPLFLYLGERSFIKGFPVALAAVVGLWRRGRHFSVGGTFWGGRMSRGEVFNALGRAWGVLFPSFTEESFGYVMVESLARGVVPISSDVCVAREFQGRTSAAGYICRRGDVDCFVEKMESLMAMSRRELVELGFRLSEEIYRLVDPVKTAEHVYRIFGVD
jgi:glycosyltransferase involved in cell wall biosynthesis